MISILLGAMISMAASSDTVVTLEDVTVSASKSVEPQMRSSQTSVHVDQEYLQLNFSGSLMQTMEGIPGVKAISIGSGQSKPTIRGLGYNRMVVSENGIKHEGRSGAMIMDWRSTSSPLIGPRSSRDHPPFFTVVTL